MKDKNIVRYTRQTLPKGTTNWKQMAQLSEDDIQYATQSDQSLWTDEMLNQAQLRTPQKKVSIHMYLDQDVVEWFKLEGKGYQTRINAVLKSYVDRNI